MINIRRARDNLQHIKEISLCHERIDIIIVLPVAGLSAVPSAIR
jgi:hypothetical protein